MSIISCAPPLWRFVRAWRAAACETRPDAGSGTLGCWVATALTRGSRDIILGVERQTLLTIVCEVGSETTFAGVWKDSVETALDDMKVPLARLTCEAWAPRFNQIEDEADADILAAVQFVCDTELHFQPDLRIVQRRLNEFPHDHPPHYVPAIAVRRLFGVRR